MKFKGDRTQRFDAKTGSGLIGRVLGASGKRWFIVVDATYDESTDMTTAELHQIVDPNVALADIEAQA